MTSQPYSLLVGYKQWADRGLNSVIAQNLGRVDESDTAILLRILDHIHVVDRVFQHHLQGVPHAFTAPRSAQLPDFATLERGMREVDDWYV